MKALSPEKQLREIVYENTRGPNASIDLAALLAFFAMYGEFETEAIREVLDEFRVLTGRNTDTAAAVGTGNG